MAGYTYTFDFFIDIAQLIIGFFSYIFDVLFRSVWSIIMVDVENGYIPQWVVDALESINFDTVLQNTSLAGLLFSTAVIAILIIYALIP